MNAVKYIEVLKGRLLPQIREWYGENPWIFQQDSAPCQTARAAKTWCAKKYIGMLPWVGNSPDMHPIEILWNILKVKMNRKTITIKRASIERPI